jgi:hypothetical protein
VVQASAEEPHAPISTDHPPWSIGRASGDELAGEGHGGAVTRSGGEGLTVKGRLGHVHAIGHGRAVASLGDDLNDRICAVGVRG